MYQQAPDRQARDAIPISERDPEAPLEPVSPLPALRWHPFCSPAAPHSRVRDGPGSPPPRACDGFGSPLAGSAMAGLTRSRSKSPTCGVGGSFRSSKLPAPVAATKSGSFGESRRQSPARMQGPDSPMLASMRARLEWEARLATIGLGNRPDSQD